MKIVGKITLTILLGFLLVSISCDKSSVKPTIKSKYTIDGGLVKDMNSNQDIAFFTILRDSIPYSQAQVKVDTVKIDSLGTGLYYREFPLNKFRPKYSYTITIFCPTDSTNISFSFVMPDTFRITSMNPPYENFQMDDRRIEWSSSLYSTKYFICVKEKPPVQGAKGFVGYPELNYTFLTIPRETFYNGTIPVFNTYYVYLVSYYKSFLSFPDIYFCLPSDLPKNNISGASGTIGIGVVAPFDSIKISSL